MKDNITYEVQEEWDITAEVKAASVIRDVVLSNIGSSHRKRFLQQPVRLVPQVAIDCSLEGGFVESLFSA